MEPDASHAQRLASLILGGPVVEWIARHRDDDRSYQWIADRLAEATDGQVKVTREAVRLWLAASPDLAGTGGEAA